MSNDSEYQSIFTQQAEYLNKESLLNWAQSHPDEDEILRKIKQTGAKLITGPRGCGKTTLMMKAFYSMIGNQATTSAFPVYVNYKSSLKLEPLYLNKSNAVYWFNQWLLLKIYSGIFSSCNVIGVDISDDLSQKIEDVNKTLAELEVGNISVNDSAAVSISGLQEDIDIVLNKISKNRCVLLLDDAAHAFSPQQQRDFFEFFRSIKSRVVSPKAAIYPGITTYSPAFHIGHDADEIDVWIKPEGEKYLDFMTGLLKKRLPDVVFKQMENNKHLLHLVCFSAFGMPRALLNMVSFFYDEPENPTKVGKLNFDRKRFNTALKDNVEKTFQVYSSLSAKLPIYKAFVEAGDKIFHEMIERIKQYNKKPNEDANAVEIAIGHPIPEEMKVTFGFLRYCGLLMFKSTSRRGEKGTYEIYSIHYGKLIESNFLNHRNPINIEKYVSAFQHRQSQTFPRIVSGALITGDIHDIFLLSLPPCSRCGTQRTNQDAKFCLHCGSALKTASVFETLVNQDISCLSLSEKRVRSIKEGSNIITIKDILMDFGSVKLKSIHGIGKVTAAKIVRIAEESIV